MNFKNYVLTASVIGIFVLVIYLIFPSLQFFLNLIISLNFSHKTLAMISMGIIGLTVLFVIMNIRNNNNIRSRRMKMTLIFSCIVIVMTLIHMNEIELTEISDDTKGVVYQTIGFLMIINPIKKYLQDLISFGTMSNYFTEIALKTIGIIFIISGMLYLIRS